MCYYLRPKLTGFFYITIKIQERVLREVLGFVFTAKRARFFARFAGLLGEVCFGADRSCFLWFCFYRKARKGFVRCAKGLLGDVCFGADQSCFLRFCFYRRVRKGFARFANGLWGRFVLVQIGRAF